MLTVTTLRERCAPDQQQHASYSHDVHGSETQFAIRVQSEGCQGNVFSPLVVERVILVVDLIALTFVCFVKGRRQSPWSMVVRNTTFEAPPSSAPRDLTVASDNPTAVTLNWQPPQHPNGLIRGAVLVNMLFTALSRT